MSKTTLLAIACAIFLCLSGTQNAGASTSYITDSFEITLRTGPSSTNKIIRMIQSDEPVEVLGEEGNWVSVRTKNGDEGYVLKRFVTDQVPKSIKIQQLQKRNAQLAALSGGAAGQIDALDKENSSLKTTLADTQKEYKQLQEKYTTLQSDAASVLSLKKELEDTQGSLKKTTDRVERLSIENKGLRASSNLEWFLSGAGVVSIAWLFGFMMGRTKRRQQSSRLF